MISSTPSIFKYDPREVPYQYDFINELYDFDYSLGVHEILLWGTVGSGKSLPAAHVAVRHCLENGNARVLLGRKALPDLKATIFTKILEHLECEELIEGKDYWVNYTSARINFRNGSEMIGKSWADRKYKKLGSFEFSAAIIEEITENDDQDQEAYDYIKMRCGRLPHIKESFILAVCNPDSPSHWVRKRFFDNDSPLIHTFESHLRDNKFLPKSYETSVREGLDPMMAKRMLNNEWIDIGQEIIYYAYNKQDNYRDYDYKVDERLPILISWDFNIGLGKPLSACFSQYVAGQFHIFDEVVVEGIRTLDSCEEMKAKGLLDYNTKFMLFGDATGRHRDTRSKVSDWDIIEEFFSTNVNPRTLRPLRFSVEVGRSNPPVRSRHNKVNATICNANGVHNLFVYKKAKTVDEGLRMTKLKPGAQYIEDDSNHFQHITTALGYKICGILDELDDSAGVYSFSR